MGAYQVRSLDKTGYSHHVRGSRFFKLYNDWYFMTREGVGVGPYTDLGAAKRGEKDFIEFTAQSDQHSVHVFLRQFEQDAVEFAVPH